MFGFFRSVAEAVVEKGVRGLVEDFVPGGKFVCDIAERVVEKERAHRQRAAQRAEFEQIVVLGYEAAQEQARAAFAEVIAERQLALPPAEVEAAVQWVAGIPEAARVSNRSAADPTGRTLSAAFALDTPDDVLKVLPPSPPRFLPGQPVPGRDGDWTLDRVLGAGGFGEVWLATHNDGYYDPRAVKFFFDQTGKDVIREADLVKRAMTAGKAERGRADDPRTHIVPILDVRLKGDAPWLMFEYVGGGNLAGWLYRLASMTADARVPQVVAALKQLCAGAGVFHGLPSPLAHRDLKPSNVLVDKATKKLRITDFGIGAVTQREANAREVSGVSQSQRQQSYLRGAHTPTYSSPQQRRGDPPDPRDDIHALGVIGYQLLVGRLDQGPGPRAAKQLALLGVPGELAELVLDCASEELADRPVNALVLRDRLDAIGGAKAAVPVAPPPPTPPVAAKPAPPAVGPKAGDEGRPLLAQHARFAAGAAATDRKLAAFHVRAIKESGFHPAAVEDARNLVYRSVAGDVMRLAADLMADEAWAKLRRYLAIDPDYPAALADALRLCADACGRRGHDPTQLEPLRKMLREAEAWAEAPALVAAARGEFALAEARSDFYLAWTRLCANRGIDLCNKDKPAEGQRLIEEAFERVQRCLAATTHPSPAAMDAFLWVCTQGAISDLACNREKGSFPLADKIMKVAPAREPNDPVLHAVHAKYCYWTGDEAGFRRARERAEELNRQTPTPRADSHLAELRQFAARGMGWGRVQVHLNKATEAMNRMQYTEALRHLTAAEAINGDVVEVQFMKYFCNLSLGNRDTAVRCFERAERLVGPDTDPSIRKQIADMRRHLN